MSSTEYLQLLDALQSAVTTTRKTAESTFDQLRATQPDNAVGLTVGVVCSPSFPLESRVFACVLLRRMVLPDACFAKMTNQAKQLEVRSTLLQLLTADEITTPKILRRSVVHCVASLATTTDQKINDFNQSWPELLQTVSSMSSAAANTQVYHRESGHDLLRRLIEAKPVSLLVHKNTLQTVMSSGLSDAAPGVRLAALQSCTEFLTLLKGNEDRALFLPLVPSLMETLSSLLSADQELEARDALQSLVSVAETQPTFWRTHLPLVWTAMCTIGNHQALEAETRTMAIEFLLALCDQAGGMVRKAPQLVSQFAQVLMDILCQVEEVEISVWSSSEENEATYGDSMDEEEISNIGEQAMDRLATSIGGKIMTPIILPLVEQYLTEGAGGDWRKKRAGLETLALCAAGCGKFFEKRLTELVEISIRYATDEHVRVRYSSLHCLGQFAADFQPTMQRKFQTQVLPVLGASLTHLNEGCERLQRLAVSALINMCNEHCDKATFMTFAKPLLEGLFSLLTKSGPKTQSDILTAVAAIASVIEKNFIHFYDVFMPLALEVLTAATPTQQQQQQQQQQSTNGVDSRKVLRGRAMECVGVIACAVGKERFMSHATVVMDILMKTYESGMTEDDPQKEFILPTLASLCQCIGSDFVPYMARIMPSLIRSATYSEEGILVVMNEEEHERSTLGAEYQIGRMNVPGQGIAVVGINTLALQEKKNAVDILLRFVYALGDHYGPFVDATVRALLPSVQKGVIPQLRSAAAAAMPGLVSAGIKCCVTLSQQASSVTPTPASMQPAQELLMLVINTMVEQLKTEENDEVRGFVAQGLSECLQHARESGGRVQGGLSSNFNPPLVGIPSSVVVQMVLQLRDLLTGSVNRQISAHQTVREDPDCDEEMLQSLLEDMEDEAGYTTSILDSLGWIIKTYGVQFQQIYVEHLHTVARSLATSELGHVSAAGICMLDDALEHCGSGTASVVVPDLLAFASRGMSSEEPMVRQASVYGIGLCARNGGEMFTTAMAAQVLPSLLAHIRHWRSDSVRTQEMEENENVDAPTDCAISALGSICLHRPEVATQEVWCEWLSFLPLDSAMGDRLEGMDVHKMLLMQTMSNNTLLVGTSNERLPQIMTILARAARGIPLESMLASANYDEGDDVALMHDSDLIKLGELVAKIVTSGGGQMLASLSPTDQQTLSGLKPK